MYKIFVISLMLLTSFSFAQTPEDLLANEKNTIKIYQQASANVVYVHRLATVLSHDLERLEIPQGAGSGIMWDKAGHVVTNFHVVQGAAKLAVTIGNQKFSATVIGAEPRKDIAVLQLNSPKARELLKSFTPFQIAPAQTLMVGQKTIAIGNPFGLDHTITTGIISALGRHVPGIAGVTIHDMIQTDASINPGNSGGPLLDSQGRLIGMNTMIYSESGSSAGIGFAVPADEIERIVTQIIQHGRVALAGIGITRVEANIAARLGVQKGLLIADVLPNTPAAKAGLRGTKRDAWGQIYLGDLIVGLNGQSVANYDELYNILSKVKIGDVVKVTILRDGKKKQYSMNTIDIAAY